MGVELRVVVLVRSCVVADVSSVSVSNSVECTLMSIEKAFDSVVFGNGRLGVGVGLTVELKPSLELVVLRSPGLTTVLMSSSVAVI